MIHVIMACSVVYGGIHTCDFLNYCVNLKVQEWVEGTEVQHKAGVNNKKSFTQ